MCFLKRNVQAQISGVVNGLLDEKLAAARTVNSSSRAGCESYSSSM